MKKIILTIAVAFIAIISNVSAQGPNIKFNESAHDFGQIEEGVDYQYTFMFTNTGDAPLIVNRVVSSCVCPIPVFMQEPIAPGQTGNILISYRSDGKPGPFNNIYTVHTNLGTGKDVQLHIKGELVKTEIVTTHDEVLPTQTPVIKQSPVKKSVKAVKKKKSSTAK
jgi:hypothetical protein